MRFGDPIEKEKWFSLFNHKVKRRQGKRGKGDCLQGTLSLSVSSGV
jgi:hypothetical protein